MNNQVQEIAFHCDQLPERFIRKKDEEYGNITNADASSPVKIPVIDVSLLTSSHLELDRLKSAVSTWGCFQAINHGIEGSLLDEVREISRLFFSLSADEKKKYLKEDDDDNDGYGNDKVVSDQQTLDWTDRLSLCVLPKHQQKLHFWPQNPTHFREVVDEYSSKIELMNEVILKSLARSLNLEENSFLDQYSRTTSKIFASFNYYPPCAWPDKVLGVKPHSDASAVTILLEDKEVEGFQLFKDGQWYDNPIVLPDALTISIGDQIEIMSNGIFKSLIHRVKVNSKSQRISVAMFCMPQTEKDIGPVEALITEDTPRRYKNVTYSTDFYYQDYYQNRRSIDACKICDTDPTQPSCRSQGPSDLPESG